MTVKTRPAAYHAPLVDIERRADGSTIVTARTPVGAHPRRLTERLEHWAAVAPDRVFLGQRTPAGTWRTVTYGQALQRVRSVAQYLLHRGLSPDRPVAILSGSDIEHAVLALACMHIGVPYAALSVSYSTMSADHAKLRFIFEKLTPGFVFAADGAQFAKAIAAVVQPDATLLVTTNPPEGHDAVLFTDIALTRPTAEVDEAAALVGPDTVAKLLFTSGTTGTPKGVITTNRMLCANLEMQRQVFACLQEEPPVLVDWLPWNHVFGGSHNFGLVLYNGGSYYIDDGRPVPGRMAETIRNLREIAPTLYLTVPKGWEELAIAMRTDDALRTSFFSRVKMLFYAAASLSQHVWDELDRLAEETVGERILMTTGLGATETAPLMMVSREGVYGAGMIGVPAPGTALKICPAGDKLEVRCRGPQVTPGYWREPALTANAFDAEGFYCLGDAVTWVDEADPQKGFRFNGRIAEDFKLATGIWVNVGKLRESLIKALVPYAADVVIAGHDHDYIAALIVPASSAVATDPAARTDIVARLTALRAASTGSSTHAERVMFLTEPLSMDAGEVTDKGSINQRQVLKCRPGLVEQLYAETPGAAVLCAG